MSEVLQQLQTAVARRGLTWTASARYYDDSRMVAAVCSDRNEGAAAGDQMKPFHCDAIAIALEVT